MTVKYDRAFEFVYQWEKGYLNHPADPGGVTVDGISYRFAKMIGLDLDGDGKTTVQDVLMVEKHHVYEIFREHFWDVVSAEKMAYGPGLLTFDLAVNAGPKQAGLILQRGIADSGTEITIDGAIGPKTLAAVGGINDHEALIRNIATRRQLFYSKLRGFPSFGRGWFNRTNDAVINAVSF